MMTSARWLMISLRLATETGSGQAPRPRPFRSRTCRTHDVGFGARHAFMRIESTRLHWAEMGESAHEPAVIALHGLNDCHLTWRSVAPTLARTRRVFMLDLPGHGFSERPDASYELGWYGQLVARWMEAL